MTPNPQRIERYSPSLINRLASCGYQAAFNHDERFNDLTRPNLFSSMGNIAHKVAEKVHSGELNDVDEAGLENAIEELWDEVVAEVVVRLTDAWAPAIPPSPEDWPGYHRDRSETKIRLRRDVEKFRQSRGPGGSGNAPRIERWIEDDELGLYGKPDRVEFHEGSPVVVDLKTGINQGGIRPEQRRQLLLYAHLVAVEHETTPTTIAIETGDGKRHTEQVTDSDIEAAVQEAVGMVEGFNALLGDSFEPLANPSADTCRFCDYRSVCDPYWKSLRIDWRRSAQRPRSDIRGDISGQEATVGGTSLTVDVRSPSDWPSPTCRVASVIEEIPGDASQVSIVDAVATAGAESLKISWDTIVRFAG
jgi:hypothetical protein